jgi:hypothetical protein
VTPSAGPSLKDPAGEPRGAPQRDWIHRAADRIVPAENPTRVIYGIVVVGALLAAESGAHESHLETIASAFIAVGIYWLAHAYASVLGQRLSTPGRLTPSMLGRALRREWAIVQGAAIPLAALLIAWGAGASQEGAVTAALWTAVASLVGFELAAAIRSEATRGEMALEVGVGLTMGLAIIALKVVLHH